MARIQRPKARRPKILVNMAIGQTKAPRIRDRSNTGQSIGLSGGSQPAVQDSGKTDGEILDCGAEIMKLKELIRMLKKADPNIVVAKGFGEGDSYRGYYEQLAFEPVENTTIGQMLKFAEASVDQMYMGYKGGSYVMTLETDVWLAKYSESGPEIDVSMVMDWVESVPPPLEKLVVKEIYASGVETLRQTLQDYANAVESDDFLDEDWPTWIYEAAVNAFFGKTLWERKARRGGE